MRLPAGAVLDVGAAAHGVRSYVAFAGGVDAEPVLGSRATDLLSGLGPAPLRDGDRLPLGARVRAAPVAWHRAPARARARVGAAARLGPRDDWFTGDALRTLADRPLPGVRGEQPDRAAAGGPRAGAGRARGTAERGHAARGPAGAARRAPGLFLADHPTTGGYPVIGVVPPEALSAAAQAPPGTPARFTPPRRPGQPSRTRTGRR